MWQALAVLSSFVVGREAVRDAAVRVLSAFTMNEAPSVKQYQEAVGAALLLKQVRWLLVCAAMVAWARAWILGGCSDNCSIGQTHSRVAATVSTTACFSQLGIARQLHLPHRQLAHSRTGGGRTQWAYHASDESVPNLACSNDPSGLLSDCYCTALLLSASPVQCSLSWCLTSCCPCSPPTPSTMRG